MCWKKGKLKNKLRRNNNKDKKKLKRNGKRLNLKN